MPNETEACPPSSRIVGSVVLDDCFDKVELSCPAGSIVDGTLLQFECQRRSVPAAIGGTEVAPFPSRGDRCSISLGKMELEVQLTRRVQPCPRRCERFRRSAKIRHSQTRCKKTRNVGSWNENPRSTDREQRGVASRREASARKSSDVRNRPSASRAETGTSHSITIRTIKYFSQYCESTAWIPINFASCWKS